MDTIRLHRSVHTLDNRLLLSAGSVLSTKVLEDLISESKPEYYQTCPLLEYGTVRHDLLRLMGRPPYDLMFSDKKNLAEVMTMLEKIHLVVPVLQSLDYFKSNDYHTYCHLNMVFALSALIARDLLPDYREWMDEVSIGPTHDIGKISVPLHILKKETPLTRAERSIIDHHVAAGYVLLSYFNKDPKDIAAVVARDHHERKDGSGMPRGIQLADRMVEIIVVCDIYDALISPRPYRPTSYDNRTAIEEITRMAEMNKIGWEVVKSLVAHNRRDRPTTSEVMVACEKRGTAPSPNFHGVFEEADGDS
ncbi:MAG TPA: HD domain-containing phosphohydrolase [Thermodesulfovibrionales bacterium]|nr:HD domain-containing phosphohydrolase [Thermodesulfovibrionales bacterium]